VRILNLWHALGRQKLREITLAEDGWRVADDPEECYWTEQDEK
jgi:hypothetical protein